MLNKKDENREHSNIYLYTVNSNTGRWTWHVKVGIAKVEYGHRVPKIFSSKCKAFKWMYNKSIPYSMRDSSEADKVISDIKVTIEKLDENWSKLSKEEKEKYDDMMSNGKYPEVMQSLQDREDTDEIIR